MMLNFEGNLVSFELQESKPIKVIMPFELEAKFSLSLRGFDLIRSIAKVFFFFALLGFVLTPTHWCYAEPKDMPVAAEAPSVRIPGYFYDFGRIWEGQVVSHDFFIENLGRQPLEISAIKTTCGCTTADKGPFTVAPARSKRITVRFNSAGKRPGKNVQAVTVFSNDPLKKEANCYVQAEIRPPRAAVQSALAQSSCETCKD